MIICTETFPLANIVKEPVARAEDQMKEIVQSLYNLIVQGYDHQGAPTIGAMRRDM